MELVNRNGQAFYIPAGDRDASNYLINSFNQWEQAFRVFTDIYLHYHLTRAGELVQYNHIIHLASLTFLWDNVNWYNREFRLHLSLNPGRSWGIILQQAWSVTLKDRHRTNDKGHGTCYKNKDICWCFNRGKCTYGFCCKFEHRCAICNKYGHGAYNCRKGDNQGRDDRGHNHFDRNDWNDHFDRRDRRDDEGRWGVKRTQAAKA